MSQYFDNEPFHDATKLPSSLNLKYTLLTLEKPIHPANFCWSPGKLTEVADNKHAGLLQLRISGNDLINNLFWRWIMNPSSNEEEISVRRECIQEIIERDTDSKRVAEEFISSIVTFNKLQNLLALDMTEGFEESIEDRLLAGDINGVKIAIKEWFHSLSMLKDSLAEVEQYNSPLIFTGIRDIRSCLDTMPRPSTIDIDIALMGDPDPKMGRWIREIFLPCYDHWNRDNHSPNAVLQIATLFLSAFTIQKESFCKAVFSDSEEKFINCWNGTLQQYGDDDSRQTCYSSGSETPVTLLKGGVMSGKTFALQRRLFLTLFAQTFGYAPGEEVTLRCYQNIHSIDRGRTKSEENLSSFGASQKAIAKAFDSTTSRTLFISDELANETDRKSEDGLIYGIVRALYEAGTKVYVATHSKKATHTLEQFPWTTVLHPKITITPLGELDFQYILESGADESYADKVAQMLGMPHQVLQLMESYSQGIKLSIHAPKHIASPKIPDTDSLWRGFGYIVHPGEPKLLNINSLPIRWDSYLIENQYRLGTWEVLFERDMCEKDLHGCLVDRRPRGNKGFSLFLTRDSDFGSAPQAHSNPFFINVENWYSNRINPESVTSSLTLRTHKTQNENEPIISRTPSLVDVEQRIHLLKSLQSEDKIQEIENAVEVLRITLFRWSELQRSGKQSNFYRYCNSLYKIGHRIAHGIEENPREESQNTLKERIIGLEALDEIVRLCPYSKEIKAVSKIVEVLILLTRESLTIYESEKIKDKNVALKDLFLRALYSPEIETTEDSLIEPRMRDWVVKSLLGEIISSLIEAENASPDLPMSTIENEKIVEIISRQMKKLDCFAHSYDLLYEFASVRAYFDQARPRENFIKLLKRIDDSELHTRIEYIKNLLDMLFQDIHSISDIKRDIKPGDQFYLHPNGYKLLSYQLSPLTLITQLAKHFKKEGYTAARFGVDYAINIRQLYHPERTKSDFVPNDINIPDNSRLFILRGPNMSGKSELIKALTWAFLSGRSVGFVNGEEVVLPRVSRVVYLDRVSDSYGDGLSGWGADVTNLKTLLDFVGTEPVDEYPALVVLNEFGTSAPTEDQSSIKSAVAKLLIEAGHIVVYEGHDHEWIHRIMTECPNLCTTAHLSYEYDPTIKNDIQFTYNLVYSSEDVPSYGIEVAKKMGIPPRAIELAREFASEGQV